MNLVSVRIIAADLDRMVAFYEHVTGCAAVRHTPDFAEIPTPAGTLALGSTRTVGLFAPGSCEPAANRSAIVEFLADDVDAHYARLTSGSGSGEVDVVAGPTTMPWGNRSLLLRDPEGGLVNLFTPATRRPGQGSAWPEAQPGP